MAGDNRERKKRMEEAGTMRVDDRGQMFTLESIVAAMLLLIVAYFLFRSTLLIAPQSTQVVDVQLSQYAKDTLNLLDNPNPPPYTRDSLEYVLEHLNSSDFEQVVSPLLNSTRKCLPEDVAFSYQVVYYNYTSGRLEEIDLTKNTPTSSTVTVSRCIVIDSSKFVSNSPFLTQSGAESASYPVVLEVRLTLWHV